VNANEAAGEQRLGARSLDLALAIGERLRKPEVVGMYHDVVSAQLPYYRDRAFEPPCLFIGTSGTAMLHVGLFAATKDSVWAERARQHIDFAARSLVGRRVSTGLLGGVAGLLAAASYASGAIGGYERLRPRLAEFLLVQARETKDFVMSEGSAPTRSFDLFDGLSGICIALAKEGVDEAGEIIGSFANWLSEDAVRWRVRDPDRDGSVANDIGLAHGIGGVLAALAFCAPTSVGERSARRLISWLEERIDAEADALWPHFVCRSDPTVRGHRRIAWCYGTLGLASAIWAAAERYGNESAKAWSLHALERVAAAAAPWSGNEFALCHGLAGVTLVAHAMAGATHSAPLALASRTALRATLDARDDALDLCYRTRDSDGLVSDSATLGEGAAGIALVCLTSSDMADPAWTEYFGLPAHGVPPSRNQCASPVTVRQ
jgi:lantibiotic biosynthesis protein